MKVERTPVVTFSDDVTRAASEAIGYLTFPENITDQYKATAVRKLTACLNECLTKGLALNQLVSAPNCKPLCLCVYNETMKALSPDQFMAITLSPDNDTKAMQLLKACLATYEEQGQDPGSR